MTDLVKIVVARTPYARLRGLLGRDTWPCHLGLWIPGCKCVHTFGMRFPLALYFIDSNFQVIKTYPSVKSGRVAGCWRASSVVEMLAAQNEDQGRQQALRLEQALNCIARLSKQHSD